MKIPVKKINSANPLGIEKPKYPGDAGLDLIAPFDFVILPRGFQIIKHNFSIVIPEGFFGFIYPMSSTITMYRGELLVSCSPIDSGFRGEIFTMLTNISDEEIFISANTRLSQMVFLNHMAVEDVEIKDELAPSSRGANGFGSSGE